jgi:hypothetical protein
MEALSSSETLVSTGPQGVTTKKKNTDIFIAEKTSDVRPFSHCWSPEKTSLHSIAIKA